MNLESIKLIYTFGTSTRSSKEFIELLSNHDVAVVADVRRFPSSRFEFFRREKLEGLLLEVGIDYIYMGEELGGYRRGGYRGFTATSQFQAGLRKLEEIARQKRAAIVCAERLPWRCHRRFIALELENRGWRVSHIIDEGGDWVPERHPADDRQLKLA
jgi:uncharacterized protein (DUF488 family)